MNGAVVRMRVLHVVEVSHGGVVSYARDIAAEQLRRGYEVHVLAPREVFDLPGAVVHPWRVDRRKPWRYPAAVRRLNQVIARTRTQVVHLHSFFPGFFGRATSRGERPPIVFQPHAWAFDAVRQRWANTAVARWEQWAGGRTQAIACVSAEEVAEGRRRGVPVHPDPVGSPVDVDRFHPVDSQTAARWREQLGMRHRRLLVSVGRLCRQKGQDRLVAEWANSPIPDTDLVLVGPGDPESLRRLAGPQWEHSVRAVGPHEDVRPWLWAADLAVLASRYEANALVTGEALACGRPVVTTEVGGARDAVGADEPVDLPGGRAGCVVPQADVARLLDEAHKRLIDPALLETEGANARARALRLFAVSAVADRFDDLYRHAIRKL